MYVANFESDMHNLPTDKVIEKAATALPTSAAQPARSDLSFDRPLHAAVARLTGGISPAALSQAYTDWLQHLLFSPDKQLELVDKAASKWGR